MLGCKSYGPSPSPALIFGSAYDLDPPRDQTGKGCALARARVTDRRKTREREDGCGPPLRARNCPFTTPWRRTARCLLVRARARDCTAGRVRNASARESGRRRFFASRMQKKALAGSDATLDEHLFYLADRLRRVQTLRTRIRAIHDRVAAIK